MNSGLTERRHRAHLGGRRVVSRTLLGLLGLPAVSPVRGPPCLFAAISPRSCHGECVEPCFEGKSGRDTDRCRGLGLGGRGLPPHIDSSAAALRKRRPLLTRVNPARGRTQADLPPAAPVTRVTVSGPLSRALEDPKGVESPRV
jgi:hypothetical protein